jgi:RNA polymerase sigma factor (TIGR02999 family)
VKGIEPSCFFIRLKGFPKERFPGWFCCARRANEAIVSELTRILEAAQRGEPSAANELLPLVYHELRRLAAHKMAREAPGHTLQPTALVHEAWLRLTTPEQQAQFQNRAHFFGAAAEAMRRILVDRAREKKALKRGGDVERVDIDAVELPLPMRDDELLALDEALDRLATVDTRAPELVKLCFFVGLTQEEAARELGISVSTAERIWAFARAWLLREVKKQRAAKT